jgi:hypothetical protein
MMPRYKTIPFLSFMICFLSSPGGIAETDQTANGPQDETEPVRLVNVSIYAWPFSGVMYDDTEIHQVPTLFYRGGESEGQARVIRSRTTGPYGMAAPDDTVELYLKEPYTDPETGETRYRHIPEIRARIPSAWQNALLVIFPDSRENGLYRTIPMDASAGRTPVGQVRLMNGTEDELGILVGEDVMRIPPSESVLFTPPETSGAQRFPIQMYRRERGDWRMIYSSNQRMEPDKANLMVIYPTGARRVQIMNFGGIR